MEKEISLHEILDYLRNELLQETPTSSKFFFVEEVEIELYLAVRREGNAGIKISVLQFGGPEGGVTKSREEGDKITLRLKPLVSYEEAKASLSEKERKIAFGGLIKGGA